MLQNCDLQNRNLKTKTYLFMHIVKNKTLQIHIRLKTLSTETDTDFLLVKTDFLNSRDSFEFSPHLFTNQFLSYFTCSMFTMIFYVAY